MNKTFTKAVLSVTALLALGTVTTLKAHAADATPEAESHLTKTLVTPDPKSVTVPNMSFTFDIHDGTYSSNGGSSTNDSTVVVPTINDVTLDFSSSDTGDTKDGLKTTYKQSADLLSGLTFPAAGVYSYRVTENTNTNTLGANESLDYNVNNDEYILKVYVSRNADGSTKIDGSTVEHVTPGGAADSGEKITAEPGISKNTDGSAGSQTSAAGEVMTANSFNFKNVYQKTTNFSVSKTVAGDLSNTDDIFKYTILIAENTENAGQKYSLTTPNGPVEVTVGTPATFELTGGDTASISGLPAGTIVTTDETDYGHYVPSVLGTFNGTAGTLKENETSESGQLGENENKIDYTNTWVASTPTGIVMNNLPYIALIAVALGGMTFYIYEKRRKNS